MPWEMALTLHFSFGGTIFALHPYIYHHTYILAVKLLRASAMKRDGEMKLVCRPSATAVLLVEGFSIAVRPVGRAVASYEEKI